MEPQEVPDFPMERERSLAMYREPLDSPGIIPIHQKNSVIHQFPLLEIIQRLLSRFQPNSDLDKALAIIALYKAAKPVYMYLKQFLAYALTSQITVPESDPVGREILAWMSDRVISKGMTRNAMVITGGLQDPARHINMHRQGQVTHPSEEVQCLPPIGTKLFWIGFRPFLVTRNGYSNSPAAAGFTAITSKDGRLQNSLNIITLGWSLEPLQHFMKICHDYKIQTKLDTTTVYFSGSREDGFGGNAWHSVEKAIRKLDTVDMSEDIKQDLIQDAEYYYSNESKQFFADCGIPYRRGYLFYGPPGTGKTSFSAALAGHLNCDVYMINLATGEMSDGKLHRLFLALPKKCVVVIEDIDSAGIGREQGDSSENAPRPTSPQVAQLPMTLHSATSMRASARRQPQIVTLSGLLNAIDGNASQEGRLLVMTSNNPHTLDEALVRPGRVDKRIFFGNMRTPAIRAIFLRLVGRAASAKGNYTLPQLEVLAETFAERVPDDTFTPAKVQNFLQSCRGDPEKALQGVDAWVAENAPQIALSADSGSLVSDIGPETQEV
ncbi:hypothetical protein BDV95DRAFT_570467 [Massariosphaeria phaeospora]|uniref:P-loop containing nucleoside triphosphate hydrolase protein n=1 Tax=Massariosphaeria phaeospora TaxID=100035 RepID=A0A7C8M9G8_9PLEO|nr:hypothetical protein BDV95DRAFT_570467 [Massariosphaeria phaeospora]